MKLAFERELDFGAWCKRVIKTTWVCVLLMVCAEVAIYAVNFTMGRVQSPQDEVFVYVIRPAVIAYIIMIVIQIATSKLVAKKQYGAQGVVYLTGLSLIVLVLAWTHYDIAAIYTLFTYPIFISLLYADEKLASYTFLLNLALYLVAIFLLPSLHPYYENDAPGFAEMLAATIVIVAGGLIAQLFLRRQGQLVQAVREEQHKTRLDSQTGLYNHGRFYDRLDECIVKYNKTGQDFCLVIIDIDNFKRINDTYGHDAGDDIIMMLVHMMVQRLEKTDEAFRYGGEEFTILSERSLDDCIRLVNSILNAFKQETLDATTGMVTASAGICAYDKKRFGAKREFFAAADEALYEAKRSGKDMYIVWQEGIAKRY